MKDGGYKYFIQILSDQSMQYEYRTMAAFVLSMLVDDYHKGQVINGTFCLIVDVNVRFRKYVFRVMLSLCVFLNWKSRILF